MMRHNLTIVCSLPNSQYTQKVSQNIVKLTQKSKRSHLLLNPAIHEISINDECCAPKQARLLWTQSNQSRVGYLPSSRIVNNQRSHFVLVGSQHTIRTLLTDASNVAY